MEKAIEQSQQELIKEEELKVQQQSPEDYANKIQKLLLMFKTMTAIKLAKDDKTPAEIVEGLYLGSIGAAYNKESLEQHGITHILTCADSIKPRFENDFKYKILPLLDSPGQDITSYFTEANEFINEALKNTEKPGKALVHCFAGKSRSTSFVLSYLMSEKKMRLQVAFDLVEEKRPIAQPNHGFIMQLIKLEKTIFGEITLQGQNQDESFEEDKDFDWGEQEEKASEVKEISDGIQQMKIMGDIEGVREIENQI